MAKNSKSKPVNEPNNKSKKGKNKFELDAKALKFIYACNTIIEKSRYSGVEPKSRNALAKLIYPANRNIIGAVENGQKSLPDKAIINLCVIFKINMNFFYDDDVQTIKWEAKEHNASQTTANDHGVIHNGDNKNNLSRNSGKIKGVNLGGGTLNNYFMEAETMINQFPPELPNQIKKNCSTLLRKIRSETDTLTELLRNEISTQAEDIKKMSDNYARQMEAEMKEKQKLEEELSQVKESERNYMEKYLKLLEKNSSN